MSAGPRPGQDVPADEEVAHLRRRMQELARASASRQAVIDNLQAVLVPGPYDVPGLSFGVRHVAYDADAIMSGDAADVFPIDDRTCHIAMIDVTGHGVAHTSSALLLIHTLRTLALSGVEVDRLFATAMPLAAAQEPAITASGIVGRLDTVTGALRLVGAGAPPAALCRAGGDVELAELPGSPLGFDAGPRPRPVDVVVEHGDRVVLVTDGVLGGDAAQWNDRLLALCDPVSDPDVSVEEALGEMIEGALAEEQVDDATAMCLQRVPVGQESPPRPDDGVFRLRVPAQRATDVAPGRVALRRWLDALRVPTRIIDDVVLTMSELTTNAIRAARTDVEVEVEVGPDRIRVRVRDDGPGLPPAEEAMLREGRGAPDRSRGLFLVSEIASDLSVESGTTGTVITVWHAREEDEDGGASRPRR